jgi:hypothetical protein
MLKLKLKPKLKNKVKVKFQFKDVIMMLQCKRKLNLKPTIPRLHFRVNFPNSMDKILLILLWLMLMVK